MLWDIVGICASQDGVDVAGRGSVLGPAVCSAPVRVTEGRKAPNARRTAVELWMPGR
jgi:hypothetical protein